MIQNKVILSTLKIEILEKKLQAINTITSYPMGSIFIP